MYLNLYGTVHNLHSNQEVNPIFKALLKFCTIKNVLETVTCFI